MNNTEVKINDKQYGEMADGSQAEPKTENMDSRHSEKSKKAQNEPKSENPFKNPAKEKYLSELKGRIVKLPHEEYEDAVSYFAEYIEDAGLETYDDICRELGTPKEAAKELLVRMLNKKEVTSKNPGIVILAILAVLSAPISIPIFLLLIALLITAVAIVGALILALVAGIVGSAVIGAKAAFVGITTLGTGITASSVYVFGSGLLIMGLGILVSVAVVKLIQLVIYLVGKLYYSASRR